MVLAGGERPGVVVSGFLVLLLTFGGCATPLSDNELPEPPSQETDLRLVEGWSHETAGGTFSYEQGMLKGRFEGDQLVLRINNTQPLPLGPIEGRIRGEQPAESDFTRVFAIWNEEDPWPKSPGYYGFASSYTELVTVNSQVMGQQVKQSVWYGEGLAEDYEYDLRFNYQPSVTLQPGDWTLWWAVGRSEYMEVEFKLPEGLPLAEEPLFSYGCRDVQGVEFESETMIAVWADASYVEKARYSLDVPPNGTLLGVYFGTGGLVPSFLLPTSHWHWRFDLPSAQTWEYEWTLRGQSRDPPDWNGRVLASTTPGTHTFEIERQIGPGSGPKLSYCII